MEVFKGGMVRKRNRVAVRIIPGDGGKIHKTYAAQAVHTRPPREGGLFYLHQGPDIASLVRFLDNRHRLTDLWQIIYPLVIYMHVHQFEYSTKRQNRLPQ